MWWQVLAMAFDMAEGQIRKEMHGRLMGAYAALTAKMAPEGAGAELEAGADLEEDEYGFLVQVSDVTDFSD